VSGVEPMIVPLGAAPVSGGRPAAGPGGEGRSDGGPIVEVREASFAYDPEHPVLKSLSFDVAPGDFVGVVGPNGSGKSTLLDLIDGVLSPGSGAVLINGRGTRQYRRRDMARQVALVPQHFALGFDLTVREVVEMGAYCRGAECSASGAAAAALEKLGIAELAERRFPHLSGGEKQMVVLAQALVQNAGVLLLDEPASSLDVSHQLRLFELLKELNADGLTVICVLHDLNLALTYFTRLLVLSQGGIAAWGPAEEALSPEVLEAVYGVRALVHHHAGRTYLTFSPRAPRKAGGSGHVHLVCGGGSGSSLMRELTDRGYEVSAGVLNALDSDEVTGRELGLSMAVEAPFSPIGDDAHAENLRLMSAADVVVLADVPLGHGNARNLDAVQSAVLAGKPVWVAATLGDNDPDGLAAALGGATLCRYGDEREVLDGIAQWQDGDGGS
jgi:iron complex transport system ATP-binding protein